MGEKKTFYVKYLKQELERRMKDNDQYSLRAFAKCCDVDASFLSKVLAKKQTLSLKKGEVIAEALKLEGEIKKKFFVSIADSQKCKALKKIGPEYTDCGKGK